VAGPKAALDVRDQRLRAGGTGAAAYTRIRRELPTLIAGSGESGKNLSESEDIQEIPGGRGLAVPG
jgi:hypothetical protein